MAPAVGSSLFERMLRWLRAGYPQGIPQQDYVALFGILHRSLTDAEIEEIARALHEGEGGLDSNIPAERIREIIRHTVHQDPTAEDVRRVASRLALGGWPLVPMASLAAAHPEPEVPLEPEASPGSAPDAEPGVAAQAAPPVVPATPALPAPVAPLDPAPAPSVSASAPQPRPVPAPEPLRPPTRAERVFSWLKAGYPRGIPEADFVPLLGLLQRRLSADELTVLADRLRGSGLVPANRVDVGAEYLRITRELPDEAELQRVVDHLRAAGVELADDDGPVA
ncbi:MAG: DUF3349 domain-containing protein [Propioniciclava sp.]|uniref:DUF3349 domain-containing protein n=1 Tax=Propioniciclava sp. TaxID=2038686 RepID=UPI0039E4B37C